MLTTFRPDRAFNPSKTKDELYFCRRLYLSQPRSETTLNCSKHGLENQQKETVPSSTTCLMKEYNGKHLPQRSSKSSVTSKFSPTHETLLRLHFRYLCISQTLKNNHMLQDNLNLTNGLSRSHRAAILDFLVPLFIYSHETIPPTACLIVDIVVVWIALLTQS